MNQIIIHNTTMPIVEYCGQRVVTLAMIDQVHERPEGTARRNFNEHRERLIQGQDYFKVCADEIRTRKIMEISTKAHEDVTCFTEQGYLMLVKSLQDDLAWDVQRQLVNRYFRPATAPVLPQDLPTALRLAADLAEENGKLTLANEHQAQTIASLESLFMTGETPTQFCKRLRGVNVSKVNRSLLVLGWLFDSAADDRSKPRYRVASRVRDRYLTERPRKISTEGADSFVRYDLILLLRGAKRLHELYMTGQLIMKASWDGIFTHAKYSGGDHDE